ncbi:helix-turn-helix domain-containing protein, partial [Roseicitreum antarcticum]
MRGRASVAIALSEEERVFLEAQLRRHKAARSLSDRCRIVLRCAGGLTSKEIAAELGHSEHTVGKWRRRFAEHRIEGLSDEYRAGRPRTISDEQVADGHEGVDCRWCDGYAALCSGHDYAESFATRAILGINCRIIKYLC